MYHTNARCYYNNGKVYAGGGGTKGTMNSDFPLNFCKPKNYFLKHKLMESYKARKIVKGTPDSVDYIKEFCFTPKCNGLLKIFTGARTA